MIGLVPSFIIVIPLASQPPPYITAFQLYLLNTFTFLILLRNWIHEVIACKRIYETTNVHIFCCKIANEMLNLEIFLFCFLLIPRCFCLMINSVLMLRWRRIPFKVVLKLCWWPFLNGQPSDKSKQQKLLRVNINVFNWHRFGKVQPVFY